MTYKKNFSLLLFFCLFSSCVFSQDEVIKLWPDTKNHKEKRSELRVFLPAATLKSTSCFIICPGGSYHHLGLTNEGSEVAETLNKRGISVFVLRYRVGMHGNHFPAMLEDAQRAIQIVKENADKYKIDTSILGCMGFSAGGHLALMMAAFSNRNYLKDKGIKTSVGLSPAFVCAVYPVVSMQDSIAHRRSRKNLLTGTYTDEIKNIMSMELQVTAKMPPVFLLACDDDPVVDVKNSLCLNEVLTQKGVDHYFLHAKNGGHGFGTKRTVSEETHGWYYKLFKWMELHEFLCKENENGEKR